MSRWPVEETGSNSVIPSMIPKMTAMSGSGIRCLERNSRRVTSKKSRQSTGGISDFDSAFAALRISVTVRPVQPVAARRMNEDFDFAEAGPPGVLKPAQKVGAGKFTLLRRLGGGTSDVWLARDEHRRQAAALKFLPSALTEDPN